MVKYDRMQGVYSLHLCINSQSAIAFCTDTLNMIICKLYSTIQQCSLQYAFVWHQLYMLQ